MKIAIYNRGITFDGSTPFRQSLGGSESSIVHVARELARTGHEVTVYAKTPEPSVLGDALPSSLDASPYSARASRPDLPLFSEENGVPRYCHYHQFFKDYTSLPWDVVISFRSLDPFLLGRVAPRMIFWCGDASDQSVLKHFEHKSLQENIDLIFCVSNWHRESFIEAFKLPSEKVIATRNGFCSELIPEPVPNREWSRCVYSSTPFRGLDILLKIFPKMRAAVPSLSLDVFSSMEMYGWTSAADQQEFGSLYRSASQPGVTWHGGVPQPVLLQFLSQAGLLLYPNTFAETSCMAAIEAQASGCVVVTSARAALNETVEHETTGLCLKGEPSSIQYQREFIAAVTGLLNNPTRLAQLSRAARDRAFRMYTWAAIVSEWTAIFQNMPPKPVHGRWAGPLALVQKTHEFLGNGNVSAAARVLTALEQTPFLPNEVDVLKGKLSTWM